MRKGCSEALYVKHLLELQTARPLNIVVWSDSSAKFIMQRFGPGRRAKHLEVHTLWFQQLVKIGLISSNKVNTLENCADVFDKARAELQSELLRSDSCSNHETRFVVKTDSYHDSRFEKACWDVDVVTTTQLYGFFQCRNWSLRKTFSSTSCWAFILPQHVGNDTCSHKNNFFRLGIQTREDARIHMTDFFRIWIGMEFHSSLSSILVCCLIFVRIFVPRRQSVLLLNGMREHTIDRPFLSLIFALVSRGLKVMTETTWISFGSLSMWFPLKTLFFFPLYVGFCFFFDFWWLILVPHHRFGL